MDIDYQSMRKNRQYININPLDDSSSYWTDKYLVYSDLGRFCEYLHIFKFVNVGNDFLLHVL